MAIAKKCDICGKFYEPYGGRKSGKINYNSIKPTWLDNNYYVNDSITLDCFPNCMSSISQHIENIKKELAN